VIIDNDRPIYHHLPNEGLLWDPAAAIFWEGRYHVFYLHSSWENAGPPRRADGYIYKAWAHISSADLINWESHSDALQRGQTGNLFLFNGTPTIIYPHPDRTGDSAVAINPERNLENWEQFSVNPVRKADPKTGQDVTAWQEGQWCYALTLTRDLINGGDTQHLYRSEDLQSWEHMHQFYTSERRWTHEDDDCACPDFFQMGDRWMLLHFCHRTTAKGRYGRRAGSRYYLGRYENNRFYPESFDRINWPNGNIHAPRSMLDDQGRRLLFTNLSEGRTESASEKSGWSGVLGLPVIMTLAPEGDSILYEPVPELQALRTDPWEKQALTIEPNTEVLLPVGGDCMELNLEFEPKEATEFGVKVRCAPDGSEETRISFINEPRKIRIDYSKSSLRDDLDSSMFGGIQEASLKLAKGENIKLRIFLDRSVLEVFANNQRYLAQRIYPSQKDSLGIKLFTRGGSALCTSAKTWTMKATNH